MIKRLIPPQFPLALEATLVALFIVQALRFAIGSYYSRVAGASIVSVLDPALLPAGTLSPAEVGGEVSFLVYMLLLPLLAVILGRVRALIVVAAIVAAVGRALLNAGGVSPSIAAAITLGGGLLYIAMLIRSRASLLAPAFVIALGTDQLLRAAGDTLDPSWSPLYSTAQLILSILVILLAITNLRRRAASADADVSPDHGVLPLWGGVGLGGLLFLQLGLLTMPNAIAGRAGYEYTPLVPLTLAATLAPLIPWVRARARDLISLFDAGVRGWVWLLLIALLVILGTRLSGVVAGAALVLAQLLASLLWWWLARPAAEKERNLTGVWIILAVVVFALLAAGDFFTYEYAYVRNLTGNLSFLNPYIPPLLRGFRGLGLGVLLLAVFFAALPMTQTLRRVAWSGVTGRASLGWLALVIAAAAGGAYLARPPVITPTQGVDSLRIATYNIHAGTDEFFAPSLPAIRDAILVSGANVVMLQEVEAGRLTSFGVDQALWLARQVNMDRRFYAANEGLQGLATLSSVPIALADGVPLPGAQAQTAAQRVQITPRADATITLYNTWLGVLTESADATLTQQESDQTRQLTALFNVIAAQHPNGVLGRTVVGGTFHNVPDSPLVAQMRSAGFDDPFAGLPIELSATLWRTGLPRVRFDYLWLRNLGRLSAGVLDSSASDHRMAVAEVAVD
jgi:endonuclease/exonuclease/phosphatase family metal-dependent hydrolase/uncharacterized protein YggT (Ycf19 family)